MRIKEAVARWTRKIRNALTSQQLYREFFGARDSASGVAVTVDSAMTLAAFWSCVRVASEDVGKLPLILYRRVPKGKERATDHWLYWLLHDQPNEWQTPLEFRETMQAHIETGGNAYALKTVYRNEVRELLPLPPWRVSVEQQANYTLKYELELPDGGKVTVPTDRIMHVRGLSLDGVHGLSPVAYHRETIGSGLSMVEHGARTFKNGAQIRGILSRPAGAPALSPEAAKRFRESWDEAFGGSNSNKTALVEEGTTYNLIASSNRDAQYLEARGYTRGEIAAIFRIPPHKIGDLTHATFTNIEHQGQEYLSDGLDPRLCRWEQAIARDLIRHHMKESERRQYFAEFLRDGILRSDTVSRYTAYATGVTNGWLSRNEVRERENMNREDGLDEFLTPLNMQKGDEPPGANGAKPPANGARPAVAAALDAAGL